MRLKLAKFSAFLLTYGPWGIFALSLIDSMGIPLPATTDLLLLGVGVESIHNPSRAYLAAFMATLGSLIGNTILFQGARHGKRLMTKQEREPGKFQGWFQRYGMLTVFVPAVVPFVPLPLKVFVISAGAFRTPFSKFLAVVLAARVIRYFGMAYIALQLGVDAEGFLRRNAWTIVGVVIALMGALYIAMRWKERRLLKLD
jgi:membrane protein YqaA with SNARE-associated domain